MSRPTSIRILWCAKSNGLCRPASWSRAVILNIPGPARSGIKHSKRQECNSKSRCSTARERIVGFAFDFRKQSAHFANEQPPTLWVFRCLEAQEGLFKLSQKFEYFVLSHAGFGLTRRATPLEKPKSNRLTTAIRNRCAQAVLEAL
jgi:hypothetical protein